MPEYFSYENRGDVYVGSVRLDKGDSLTIVRRANDLPALKDARGHGCIGHRYTLNSDWQSSVDGVSYINAECYECRSQRVVTRGDLVSSIRTRMTDQAPPPKTPVVKGEDVFVVKTAEVIDGIVGQVVYEYKIVWQSGVFPLEALDDKGAQPAHAKAIEAAKDAKDSAVRKMFSTTS